MAGGRSIRIATRPNYSVYGTARRRSQARKKHGDARARSAGRCDAIGMLTWNRTAAKHLRTASRNTSGAAEAAMSAAQGEVTFDELVD
jgi:hypothetical protein